MVASTLQQAVSGAAPSTRGLPDRIILWITGEIRSGSLASGQRLPAERELARSLGVSRPMVREAIRALSILGLLEIRHGDGVYVTRLDPADLLAPMQLLLSVSARDLSDLFEVRKIVEAGTARLAAARIDAATLERLGRIVAEAQAARDDMEVFNRLDSELHDAIADAAGNPLLRRLVHSLYLMADAGRELTAALPGGVGQCVDDHAVILAALARRDPEGAAAAMRQHLANVQKLVEQAEELVGKAG